MNKIIHIGISIGLFGLGMIIKLASTNVEEARGFAIACILISTILIFIGVGEDF